MSKYTQDGRFLSVVTALAKDELLLTSINGFESVSSLFHFNLTALSENIDIKPEALIHKSITFSIHEEEPRVFNGYVSHFSFGEIKDGGMREYHLTVVPWAWFLDQSENRKVFQNQTTKDIVSQVFKDAGYNDFDFKAKPGTTREYCVQYGESDLTFVMRLLAEEGYASFFKHEEKKHTMVIVDQMSAYAETPQTELIYSKGASTEAEINSWQHNYEFRKGEWIVNDYNFKEPNKNLTAKTSSKSKFEKNANFKHYAYPGLYEPTIGVNTANARMDAEEAASNTISGKSNCISFSAGTFFNLAKHEAKSEQGKYLLLNVAHQASDTSYSLGQGSEKHYSNSFNCIPLANMYRPPMVYNRPVMHGPQSALVTGPKGDEIHIDEFGRIKVQFMWDQLGKKDENSSCYIRVMQGFAGNGWGSSFVPRIGQEVIISFLDGDADRPIVSGAVYNGNNKPPFASKTQSGIKTHSSKDGSNDNFNELSFEDKKDSEKVYLQAEKDLETLVKNDESIDIGNNRVKTIKNNEDTNIGNDRTKNVSKDESEKIGGNKTIEVGKDHTESIGKSASIDVGKDINIRIADNHSETIGKNMSITVEKDLQEKINGKYSESVTKEYGLKAKEIKLEADKQITLKTGSAQIVMKSNGDITISGKNINVKGSGNVVLKGSKVQAN